MNPQSIKEMYEYTYWAFDLIWPSIEKLSNEQFTKDLGYSYGSIRNQIIHLISSHRRWLYRLKFLDPPQHLEFEEFPTKTSVRIEWDSAKFEMLELVNSIDNEYLNEEIEYELQGRAIKSSSYRWEILLHLFNHSTDHRAQLLALLNTQYRVDTPEQDYIFYLWERRRNL